MTNFDVCVAFVNGSNNGCHSENMLVSQDGSKLYSYGTVIAQKLPSGAIILNDTKYSVTTSKHQSHTRLAISRYAKELKTYHTDKFVPMGAYDLIRYYSK